jgi:hypothetical protein
MTTSILQLSHTGLSHNVVSTVGLAFKVVLVFKLQNIYLFLECVGWFVFDHSTMFLLSMPLGSAMELLITEYILARYLSKQLIQIKQLLLMVY